MRKVKLIIPLLLMLFVSIGNVWGEDATMAAGTNGTTATVNGKSAIKVGTNNKGGTMTITVPAGATQLDLYAAAWNGVTGLSLNITPAAKVSPTSISLTADANISGSSPFTLSGQESDYKFTIALSNITAETTLTFTSSTTKRFVVWGATYTTSGGGGGGGSTYTVVFKSPLFQLPILKIPASFMLPHPSCYHPSDTREIPERYTAHPLLIQNILFLRFPQSLSSFSVRRNIVSAFLQIPLSHSVRAGLIKRCNRHISFSFLIISKTTYIYTQKAVIPYYY